VPPGKTLAIIKLPLSHTKVCGTQIICDASAALFPGGILCAPKGQDDFNADCDSENDNDEEYEACEKLHKNICIDAVLKTVMQS